MKKTLTAVVLTLLVALSAQWVLASESAAPSRSNYVAARERAVSHAGRRR